MIKCPNPDCGYENVDGTQFCEGCSEELTPQAGAATAPTGVATGAVASNMIKCPACDNLNAADNVVCEVCGSELRPTTAAGSGTVPPPVGTGATTTASGGIGTPDAITQATGATLPTGIASGGSSNTGDTGIGAGSVPAANIGSITPPPDDTTTGGAASPPSSTISADTSSTMAAPSVAPDLSMPGLSDSSAAIGAPVVAGGDTISAVSTPSMPAVPAPDAGLTVPSPDATAAVATTTAPDTSVAGDLQPGHVKLIVEQGMSVGAQFVLGDPELLVGREDEEESIYPDIDLSDQDAGYVHRRHAQLKFDNGHLMLTHLGGVNKTRINNRPLPDNEPQPVKMGDKIAFGKVVMRVQPA